MFVLHSETSAQVLLVEPESPLQAGLEGVEVAEAQVASFLDI